MESRFNAVFLISLTDSKFQMSHEVAGGGNYFFEGSPCFSLQ